MQNISLKRATLKEGGVVLGIEKIAKSKTYANRNNPKKVKAYITNNVVYLIKNKNATLGTVSYEIKKPNSVHINGLIVKPQYRGQGVAKQAMKILLTGLKGKKVDLCVHPHNTPAIMLYLSLGFRIESWKNNYFGDGEPRLILVYKR